MPVETVSLVGPEWLIPALIKAWHADPNQENYGALRSKLVLIGATERENGIISYHEHEGLYYWANKNGLSVTRIYPI
jgi:hypothetical protein